jgi:hypothetical protein
MKTTGFLIIGTGIVEGRFAFFYWDGDEFVGLTQQQAIQNCAIKNRKAALASLQEARLTPGLAHMQIQVGLYEIVDGVGLHVVSDERI